MLIIYQYQEGLETLDLWKKNLRAFEITEQELGWWLPTSLAWKEISHVLVNREKINSIPTKSRTQRQPTRSNCSQLHRRGRFCDSVWDSQWSSQTSLVPSCEWSAPHCYLHSVLDNHVGLIFWTKSQYLFLHLNLCIIGVLCIKSSNL